jgi:hypothetical protein
VGRDDFGDDGKTKRATRLGQQPQSVFTKSLKIVWRGSRFEYTAAQDAGSNSGYCLGSFENLLLGFNRAGAGDDGKLVGSDEACHQSFFRYHQYMALSERLNTKISYDSEIAPYTYSCSQAFATLFVLLLPRDGGSSMN